MSIPSLLYMSDSSMVFDFEYLYQGVRRRRSKLPCESIKHANELSNEAASGKS